MRVTSAVLLAALTALISAGLVATGAWFLLKHRTSWLALMDEFGRTGAGGATVAVVVLAGILLSVAFGRAQTAVSLMRQSSESRDGERP